MSKIIEYSNTPPSSKDFLKILRTNAKLHYENTQLKIRLTSILPKKVVDSYLNKEKQMNFRVKKISRRKNEERTEQDSKNSLFQHTTISNKYMKYVTLKHSYSFPCIKEKKYKSYSDSRLFGYNFYSHQ